MSKDMSDTWRTGFMACETLTKQFPDLKNPHLESKMIKIGQEIPKLCTFVLLLKIF